MPAQAGGGTKPWQGWESGAREEVRQFLRALRIGLLDGPSIVPCDHVVCRLEQGLESRELIPTAVA